MYYCCKGCDECCQDICKCCEECCGEYCDAISECFSTPFSFCTFMASFITIIPFILMIVAIVQSASYDCKENIKVHLIIQGICNLLNFLFCVYLMCQYGKSYDGDPQGHKRNHDGPEEYNIMQRTVNLILYDFVVCFYIIFLVFFIIWSIIGSSWINAEVTQQIKYKPSSSPCYKKNNGFLITADQINIWTMWAFIIIGFIIFMYILMVYACDDGSCTCDDSERCCCLIMTCGLCDLGSKQKNKYSKQQAQQNRQQYKDPRHNWLRSSKRVCGCLSLERRPREPYQQNQHVGAMNQGVQMQTYNQNPAVRPPPERGILSGIKNLFKKDPVPPPPQPPVNQFAYNPQPPVQQYQQYPQPPLQQAPQYMPPVQQVYQPQPAIPMGQAQYGQQPFGQPQPNFTPQPQQAQYNPQNQYIQQPQPQGPQWGK